MLASSPRFIGHQILKSRNWRCDFVKKCLFFTMNHKNNGYFTWGKLRILDILLMAFFYFF